MLFFLLNFLHLRVIGKTGLQKELASLTHMLLSESWHTHNFLLLLYDACYYIIHILVLEPVRLPRI